jgi:WD40 repeat protein
MPGLKAADAVVHIWDWSRSPHSRVLKDVELLTAYAALSPCGRWLLKASGDIFDLNTGQRKTIDLGAAVRVGDRWDEGLNDIRFSPDGGRLAVLIGSRTDEGALRGELRIVEFPTGKRLCQFPAGEPYKLRIGFSPDGKQVVTGNPARQILRRDATTGEVITVYEPALDEQVYSATFSPDARFVAATQDEGDLLVWEADTRRLVFKQHGRGEDIDVGCLRFSPDSKFLAAADWSRVTVYDAATGRVVGEIKPRRWSPSPTVVHWSADGEKLTVVNGGPAGTEDGRDIYPSVQEWDWKSGELLQSLDASAPAKDGS